MFGKSLQGLLLLLSANLIIKPIWIFGIDRGIQNEIGTAAYGEYYSIFGFITLFTIFLDLGINNFTTKSISTQLHTPKELLASFVPIKGLLLIGFYGLTLAVGYLLGFLQHEPWLFVAIASNIALSGFLLFWRSILGGLLKFKVDSFISILDRVVALSSMLLVLGLFAFEPKQLLYAFVLSQTLGLLISNLIVVFYLSRELTSVKLFSSSIQFKELKSTLPYASYVFLMYLYSRMDVVMIDLLHPDGNYQNGVYAQSFRIVEASNSFTYLFGVVLLPSFGALLKKPAELVSNLKAFENIMLGSLSVFFISLSFFGDPILQLLYSDYAKSNSTVFSWIIFYGLFYSFNYIHGALLTASGVMKSLNSIALISLLINLGLNWLLIPTLGAEGAAKASFVTQAFSALCVVSVSYFSIIREKRAGKNIIKLVAVAGLFWVACYFIQAVPLYWHWQFAICLTSGIGLLLALKIVEINYFARILKPQEKS